MCVRVCVCKIIDQFAGRCRWAVDFAWTCDLFECDHTLLVALCVVKRWALS